MSLCAKCGAAGKLWEWTVAPCALDREEFTFWLCDDHDIEKNRETLELLGVSDVEARMVAYAEKVRGASEKPGNA